MNDELPVNSGLSAPSERDLPVQGAVRVLEPSAAWPGGPYKLASFGTRVAASLIDSAVVLTIAALLITTVVFTAGLGKSINSAAFWVVLIGGVFVVLLTCFFVVMLYAPLLMMRTGKHNGQSLGKQLLRIKVIRVSGQQMDFGWSFLREAIVKVLLFGALANLTFGIAYIVDVLWPLWDAEHRALHDFAVRTRVVSTRS